MQVKSPFKTTPKPAQPSAFDIALGFQQVQKLAQDLQTLRDEHKDTLDQHAQDFEKTVIAKMAEIDAVVSDMKEAVAVLQTTDFTGEQGEPGINGNHAPEVDIQSIIEEVKSSIRVPKDGETPVIDEVKIAKMAANFVKVPTPKIPKIEIPKIDHAEVADKVLEILQSGKKKLSTKHIGDFTDGMEKTLRPIRSLMAGFRGGGDVVTAGSNVTITTNADGKKVIATSGGTIYSETPTGAVNGSNKVYTTLHTITTVISLSINGQFIHPAEYTVSGAGFTMGTALDTSLSGTGFTIVYT